MPRKNNNISKIKNKKPKDSFLSDIIAKNLVPDLHDSEFDGIVSSVDDQFHYIINIIDNKLEMFYSPSIKKVTGYTLKSSLKFKSLGRECVHEEIS